MEAARPSRRSGLGVIIAAFVLGMVGLLLTVAGLRMALDEPTDCTGTPLDLVTGGGLAAAVGVVLAVTGLVLAAFANVRSREKTWTLLGAMLAIAVSLSPVAAWYVAVNAAPYHPWFTCPS